jgi:hypothetical protein
VRVTRDHGDGLKEVQILRMPLPVSARSTQHFDEVMREFALITLDTERAREDSDSARRVPVRLLALVDELTKNFSAFTEAVTADREEAAARGDQEVDLIYRLPATAAEACHQLEDLLAEVDDFCRSGQHLITLATSPESVAFRRWYLSEFTGQIEQGRDPVSWPDYVAEHHRDADWAKG